MRRRLIAIMKKEFIHILRDWKSLVIIILMPIMMILLYGYAITLDMKNIKFGVIDDSRSPQSRDLIQSFVNNGFFILTQEQMSRDEIEHDFMRRNVQMVIVIPKDFSETLVSKSTTAVQILIDASDSNVGKFINNYCNRVIRLFNERNNPHVSAIVTLEPRILYNPDMKSAYFFVPALVAIILLLISALLTSIAITREKETGTMEQILVSPVRPFEIIIGKVIPYILIGCINGSVILLCANIIFEVPVIGSLWLIALLSLVYIFAALSFGLMISSIAPTQQVAMFMTLMMTVLPTMLLSGFLFPIASMPYILQLISRVIPATYFLVIIRGIMLKGIGLYELWSQTLSLLVMGILLVFIAVKRFNTNLER